MNRISQILLACFLPAMGLHAQAISITDSIASRVDSVATEADSIASQADSITLVAENAHYNAVWKKRNSYFSLGYMNQTLTHLDQPGLEWKSDFGIILSWGRTYNLHKKPLFNMLKFGIDAVWADISYAKYADLKEDVPVDDDVNYGADYDGEGYSEKDFGVHQLQVGMGVGPSITLNPVDHLKLNGYFHFVPSMSVVVINDEANTSYVSNFSVGGAVSYKCISLGIESQWGKAKYKSFSINEDEGESESDFSYSDISDILKQGNNRLKTKSLRFFLIFRY